MSNNQTFITRDIQLGAYLLAKGIQLIDIQPTDSFHSKFIFEKTPRELIDYWISDGSWERSIISCYRHLVGDSRRAQNIGGE